MSKFVQVIALYVALLVPLFGCSEIGKKDAAPPVPEVGILVDDRVQGLIFESASRSGVTGPNGEFEFVPGEVVTFRLGDSIVGSITGKTTVVVSEIVGVPLDSDIDSSPAPVNVARLLQSLDADLDPSNGIQVPAGIEVGPLNFSQPIADFAADPAVMAALKAVGQSQLVNATLARNRLQASIDDIRADGDGRPNERPVASAGSDLALDEGAQSSLSAQASSDSDGQIVEFLWSEITSFGVNIASPNAESTVVTMPNVGSDTLAVIQVRVVDNQGASAADQLEITIRDGALANQLPTVSAGQDQVVQEGMQVQLFGHAEDSDGSISAINWLVRGDISIALNDAGSLSPSFTAPQVDNDSVVTLRLTATDNSGDSVSDDVRVTITDVVDNILPLAFAGGDQNVAEGETVTLDGRASTDEDGRVIGFLWTNNSATPIAINNANQAVATFVAPQVEENAVLDISLKVTDDAGGTDVDDIRVNVTENGDGNAAPTAAAGVDQDVNEGESVTLDGSGSEDPDGRIESYDWAQTLGDPVTIENKTSAVASFVAPVVASDTTLAFRLTVIDDDGVAATDDVQVITRNSEDPNQPPTAVIEVEPDPVNAGDTVSLDGTMSTDPEDGQPSGFLWGEAIGSTCSLQFLDPEASSTTTTAPSDGSTECVVQLTVTDSASAENSTTKAFTVNSEPEGEVTFEDCVTGLPDFEACQQLCQNETGLSCFPDDLTALCSELDPAGMSPFCGGGAPGEPPVDPAALLGELCADYASSEGLAQCFADGQAALCAELDPAGMSPFCGGGAPGEPPVDPAALLGELCADYASAEGLAQCFADGQAALCAELDPAGMSPFCGGGAPGEPPVDPAALLGELCADYASAEGLAQCFADGQAALCAELDPAGMSPFCGGGAPGEPPVDPAALLGELCADYASAEGLAQCFADGQAALCAELDPAGMSPFCGGGAPGEPPVDPAALLGELCADYASAEGLAQCFADGQAALCAELDPAGMSPFCGGGAPGEPPVDPAALLGELCADYASSEGLAQCFADGQAALCAELDPAGMSPFCGGGAPGEPPVDPAALLGELCADYASAEGLAQCFADGQAALCAELDPAGMSPFCGGGEPGEPPVAGLPNELLQEALELPNYGEFNRFVCEAGLLSEPSPRLQWNKQQAGATYSIFLQNAIPAAELVASFEYDVPGCIKAQPRFVFRRDDGSEFPFNPLTQDAHVPGTLEFDGAQADQEGNVDKIQMIIDTDVAQENIQSCQFYLHDVNVSRYIDGQAVLLLDRFLKDPNAAQHDQVCFNERSPDSWVDPAPADESQQEALELPYNTDFNKFVCEAPAPNDTSPRLEWNKQGTGGTYAVFMGENKLPAEDLRASFEYDISADCVEVQPRFLLILEDGSELTHELPVTTTGTGELVFDGADPARMAAGNVSTIRMIIDSTSDASNPGCQVLLHDVKLSRYTDGQPVLFFDRFLQNPNAAPHDQVCLDYAAPADESQQEALELPYNTDFNKFVCEAPAPNDTSPRLEWNKQGTGGTYAVFMGENKLPAEDLRASFEYDISADCVEAQPRFLLILEDGSELTHELPVTTTGTGELVFDGADPARMAAGNVSTIRMIIDSTSDASNPGCQVLLHDVKLSRYTDGQPVLFFDRFLQNPNAAPHDQVCLDYAAPADESQQEALELPYNTDFNKFVCEAPAPNDTSPRLEWNKQGTGGTYAVFMGENKLPAEDLRASFEYDISADCVEVQPRFLLILEDGSELTHELPVTTTGTGELVFDGADPARMAAGNVSTIRMIIDSTSDASNPGCQVLLHDVKLSRYTDGQPVLFFDRFLQNPNAAPHDQVCLDYQSPSDLLVP